MLIHTQATLALHCPNCGKMVSQNLSRFRFQGNERINITCECGTVCASVWQKGGDIFWLETDCVMCDSKHITTYKARDFWNNFLINIDCEYTGIEIGYLGPRDIVTKKIKKAGPLNTGKDISVYDRYFVDPKTMSQVLEILRERTRDNRIICSCGKDELALEIFPDRIELSCSACQAVGIVFAETGKDLLWVKNMSEIRLEAHTYQYLDEKRIRRQSPSKK